jgi:hypothetical protein
LQEEVDRIDKMRLRIQQAISRARSTLDSMLDALQGFDNVLPDKWIDEFEDSE